MSFILLYSLHDYEQKQILYLMGSLSAVMQMKPQRVYLRHSVAVKWWNTCMRSCWKLALGVPSVLVIANLIVHYCFSV